MGKTYKDLKKFSSYQTVEVPSGVSLCVFGDVHEHKEQFDKLINEYKPSQTRWLVSVGDIYDKGFGEKEADRITDTLMELQKEGICFAVRGNHELKQIKRNKEHLSKQLKWWRDQPLVLSFEFERGKKLTVVHAGVSPKMTADHLGNDIEVCYVRDVDESGKMIPLTWAYKDGVKTLIKARPGGKSWHELYDGRFGYIAAGHNAQKDGAAKFFDYSCNLDSAVYETGILTGQVFNSSGNLEELITVTGKAASPELNEDH